MRSEKGFSLIELLIVVAIILIIAAIAIPRFLQSRMAANEASAIASCRTIVSAEITYDSVYSGYSTTLIQLGPSGGNATSESAANLIDEVMAAGVKSGYEFTYTPGPSPGGNIGPANFDLYASPETEGQSGIRHFYTDGSGVIRQNVGAVATATDSPLD